MTGIMTGRLTRQSGGNTFWVCRCAIAVGLFCLPSLASAQQSLPEQELGLFTESAELMGVQFTISLYAPSQQVASQACQQAFERISEIETRLSNYQADSEVNQLCQSKEHFKVSDDLWFVLKESVFYWELSKGAFDVSIGRITRLWRRARRQKEFPAISRIREERAFVGSQFIKLDAEQQAVTILKPGLLIDLGAIGKGYAADEAMKILASSGIRSAVINASGDVLFGDPPPGKKGWPAAIGNLSPDDPPIMLQPLANVALATSGDAYQYLEYRGRRYSHIVDPRTGIPVKGRGSVSVLSTSGLKADALASALSVLGPRKGLELVGKLAGTESYIGYQRRSGKSPEIYRTEQFPLKSKQ